MTMARHRGTAMPMLRAKPTRVIDAAPPAEAGDAATGEQHGTAAKKRDARRLVVRMVRREDYVAVRAMAWADHTESVFASIPFSEEKFARFFTRSVDPKDQMSLGLIATLADKPVGFCNLHLGEFYIGDGAIIATMQVIYVDPACRRSLLGGKAALRLLRAARAWSATRGASHMLVHVTGGIAIKGADRLLRATGMQVVGGNYVVDTGGGAAR